MDAEAFHVEFGGAPEKQVGIGRGPMIQQYYCFSRATIQYGNVGMGCIYIIFVTFSCAASQENHFAIQPPLVDPIWPLQTL